MNSQPYTAGQRQDAAKRRREYLGKKAGISLGGTCLRGVCALLGIISLVLASAAGQNVGWSIAGVVCFTALSLAVLGVAIFFWRLSSSCFKELSMMPYVPPVAEQIAALPAEAILVRGSDQPASAPSELLRAARAGETTDEAGELVRASK